MTRQASCVTLALLLMSSLSAAQETGLDAFREAFREQTSPGRSQERRTDAFDSLMGDSPAIAEALLEASTTLGTETARIEELRRGSLFETDTPDIELQRRRVLDPLREFQRLITWRLLEIEDEKAIEIMVKAALDDDELPFSLRLALAERAGEVEDALLSPLLTKLMRTQTVRFRPDPDGRQRRANSTKSKGRFCG